MNEKPTSISIGFLQGITDRVKLITRLLVDKRVSPILKLLPLGSLVYLLVPTDFLPIIPIDDAAVIWAGSYLFVELCPAEIVRQHQRAIASESGKSDPITTGDVIDGEFSEEKTI